MDCPEFLRLKGIADATREELRRREPELAFVGNGPVASPRWERAKRAALFGAELDVLFHTARCRDCKAPPSEMPKAA